MKEFKGPGKQKGFWGVALLVGAVGTYQAYTAQQDAAAAAEQSAAAQREANAIQQRSANVQAQRERIKQLREARVARARVLSSAVNMGIGTASTGVSGAMSSISSQYGENVGNINVAQTFAEKTAQAQQRAADFGVQAQSKMAEAAQWQQLAQTGFQTAGSLGAWDKIFGPAVQPAQAQTPSRSVGSTEFVTGPSIFKMGR